MPREHKDKGKHREKLCRLEMFNKIVEKLMQEEGMSREAAEQAANEMMSKQNLSNQKLKDVGKT